MNDERTLLVSDVDGTLLGDDPAVARFAAWRRRERQRFWLAYASGRFVDSIAESVRTTELPEPDYVIGGVGTQLRDFASGEPVADWEAPRPTWDGAAVRRILASHPELTLQPDEFQSDRKVSYYFYDASAAALAQINRHLEETGIRADLIYSSARDLDVVPRGVNKGSAAARLAQRLGVRRVIACGDSGNDASLMEQGFRGVVVANALPELKRLASERVYLSPQVSADGVLDGIRHWQAADA